MMMSFDNFKKMAVSISNLQSGCSSTRARSVVQRLQVGDAAIRVIATACKSNLHAHTCTRRQWAAPTY